MICVLPLRFQVFFFFFKPLMLTFCINSAPIHCSRDPQTSLFSNFFIKNGSHSIIYTFKNYFATVFSIFSFQLYPNEPLVLLLFGRRNQNVPLQLCFVLLFYYTNIFAKMYLPSSISSFSLSFLLMIFLSMVSWQNLRNFFVCLGP